MFATLAATAFWGSIIVLAWVYVIYPLVARGYGRLFPVRLANAEKPPVLVTVGVAVHDGAAEIGERVADIVAQLLPFELEIIVASDGSTDETADVVRRLAASDRRIRLLELTRAGQSASQAAIFEAANGDVVVLTDLETRFAPGCVAALVRPFTDPRVGCVTGVLHFRWDARTATARDEGLYWRYEQAVRAWESRAGWLAAGTGALLAVRRRIFRRAPATASLDQMLPLYCRAAGSLVVVAADATGSDRGTASPGELVASRTRIATQGIEANLRMSARIRPWRQPGSFMAVWSHKILRWATPLAAALAVLGGVGMYLAGGSVIYLLPTAAAVLVGLLATAGYLGLRAGRPIPLTGLPMTIAGVNLAFGLAWLNVVLRRPMGAWESTPRPTAKG
jgi:cellulose synthase/poly-beta-1,6-N-acetylglucosamine synthase-like glycosyltransferase